MNSKHQQHSLPVVRLPVRNLCCACCAEELQKSLRGNPHITDAKVDFHLHFEVRIEDGFLGEGLPPDEVRSLYERVFGLR